MMRNYVMRSRMYRARRVAGGGCLVLSPATTNAGGCVSRAARFLIYGPFRHDTACPASRRYNVRLTTLARYSGSVAYRSAIALSPKWRMGMMPWTVTVHQPTG
jgi:hypothetical protein